MSFFRYPGGKSKLKKEIVGKIKSQIGFETFQYREPFFGGGSIGLDLLYCGNIKQVWINDKDIGISCLWTSILKYCDEFKQRISSFVPSVKLFYEIKEELLLLSDLPKSREGIVDIGFKKLAIHQISYSGLGTKSGGPLGGLTQGSNYKIDCRWSPDYICKKVEKIHKMFLGVSVIEDECTRHDFSKLIEAEGDKVIIYLDPPYFIKGNVLYQCGFSQEDHERLSQNLKKTNHLWVLSYDDCPEVRDIYSWANVVELNVNYTITALKDKETGERLSRSKSELVISNGKI